MQWNPHCFSLLCFTMEPPMFCNTVLLEARIKRSIKSVHNLIFDQCSGNIIIVIIINIIVIIVIIINIIVIIVIIIKKCFTTSPMIWFLTGDIIIQQMISIFSWELFKNVILGQIAFLKLNFTLMISFAVNQTISQVLGNKNIWIRNQSCGSKFYFN